MVKRFTLNVNGMDYEVELSGNTVVVDGTPYVINIEGNVVRVGENQYEVSRDDGMVIVNGQVHRVTWKGLEDETTAQEQETAQPVAAEGAVTAIMPGKIVAVHVNEGDQVEEGQPVAVLEAMKMENELRAPKAGTVTRVHVKPGDDVRQNQVLVEIE